MQHGTFLCPSVYDYVLLYIESEEEGVRDGERERGRDGGGRVMQTARGG